METVELMNRVNPFTTESIQKKYWLSACNILRNSFHLNVHTLVYYLVFGKFVR